jgi:uncharacterized repeat protein (TIGR01451 family)
MRAVAAAMLLAIPVLVAGAPPGNTVPVAQADYGGYASGVSQYANALMATVLGEVSKANVAVASKGGLKAVRNELDRQVVAADANHAAYSQGQALNVELAGSPIELVAPAEAAAPPSTPNVVNNLLELPVDPLLSATAVQGEAQSLFDPNTCTLGADITRGVGYAANAKLLTSETGPPLLDSAAPDPTRNVNQTTARQLLVPQTNAQGQRVGQNFGLASEVRQTLSPVTIQGVGTIEVAGEWVLRATAGGVNGGAHIQYGPGEVSPATPVLRILDTANELIAEVLLQDILGEAGLVIPIPGVAEVAVGEDPRAIAAPGAAPNPDSAPAIAANGTSAAAAVDVARVRLLDGSAADIRIGHMEVSTRVPEGGIECGLPVSKAPDKDPVTVGETFNYAITIMNPYDCTLTNVKVVDTVTAPEGITFSIGATAPQADEVTATTVTWNDIGDIPPHSGVQLGIQITINSATGEGLMTDHVVATADCATGTGEAETGVGLTGEVTVTAPRVTPDGRPEPIPRTGGRVAPIYLAIAALGGVALLRAVRARAA